MKIIINSSTFKGTGVTQVAVSFINECSRIMGNEYYVFLSPNVANNLDRSKFGNNFIFYEFGKHSLYGLKGWPDIIRMKRLEKKIKPDIVFSVFGPSLWTPRAPHLQGYAYGHYVYKDSPLYDIMSKKEKMGVALRQFLHINLLKKEGDFFVSETEDVSRRLHELYHIGEDKLFTVSNTASAHFLNYSSKYKQRVDFNDFKFYILSSNAPNKNLKILNSVIPLLKSKNLNKRVMFYVTIPKEDYQRIFDENVQDSIINVGPLRIADCPAFVDSCDALFLPTLLECFSASYPEAMLLGKPILTSNLSFATTICGDAALYFNPLDPEEIVDNISIIVNSPSLYKELAEKGKERVKMFPSPHGRAKAYLEICNKIIERNA